MVEEVEMIMKEEVEMIMTIVNYGFKIIENYFE